MRQSEPPSPAIFRDQYFFSSFVEIVHYLGVIETPPQLTDRKCLPNHFSRQMAILGRMQCRRHSMLN
jgi:hypothetical protein